MANNISTPSTVTMAENRSVHKVNTTTRLLPESRSKSYKSGKVSLPEGTGLSYSTIMQTLPKKILNNYVIYCRRGIQRYRSITSE